MKPTEYLTPDKKYSCMRFISRILYKKGIKSEVERSFIAYLLFNIYYTVASAMIQTEEIRNERKLFKK